MIRIIPVIIFFFSFSLTGCEFKERRSAIEQKEAALQQKEQELLLLEKNLKLKEDSLNLILARRDSTSIIGDSIGLMPAELTGDWSIKMVCTETTCATSAIGDVQTDNWQISRRDSTVIINAITQGETRRIYTGHYYQGNIIRVSDRTNDDAVTNVPIRIIEIVDIRNNKMKGTRVLIQQDGCHVTYSLEMDKKQ